MAIYAFMRYSDDISDSPTSHSPQEQFRLLRQLFDETLQGGHSDHPTLPALRDAVTRFHIPPELFHQLIDGTEMDLSRQKYETFDQLYTYCYHVASVVGLICLHVFEFKDQAAPRLAEACGIAFQLTNILRDIHEDMERGRVYLPAEDLKKFNYSEQDLRGIVIDQRFRDLMSYEIKRARDFYHQGRPLLKLIEKDSRPCFWAMFRFYESLLDGVEKAGPEIFTRRVRLSTGRKLLLVAEACRQRWIA